MLQVDLIVIKKKLEWTCLLALQEVRSMMPKSLDLIIRVWVILNHMSRSKHVNTTPPHQRWAYIELTSLRLYSTLWLRIRAADSSKSEEVWIVAWPESQSLNLWRKIRTKLEIWKACRQSLPYQEHEASLTFSLRRIRPESLLAMPCSETRHYNQLSCRKRNSAKWIISQQASLIPASARKVIWNT